MIIDKMVSGSKIRKEVIKEGKTGKESKSRLEQ